MRMTITIMTTITITIMTTGAAITMPIITAMGAPSAA
jgi:hypothetical protein